MSRCTSEHVDSRLESVSLLLEKMGLDLEVIPYRSYGHTEIAFRTKWESGIRSVVDGLTCREAFDCATAMQAVLLEVWNGLSDGRIRPVKKNNKNKTN